MKRKRLRNGLSTKNWTYIDCTDFTIKKLLQSFFQLLDELRSILGFYIRVHQKILLQHTIVLNKYNQDYF